MSRPSNMNKRRLLVVLIAVCIFVLLLILRLGYIQIVKHDEYGEDAFSQQTREIPLPAKRGDIQDRNGVKLALSVRSYDVWADPQKVKDKSKAALALSEILGMDESLIFEKLSEENTDLVKIAKKINRDQADAFKSRQEKEDLTLFSIWLTDNVKRVYPYEDFLSRVLGHTNEDGNGVVGVEKSFDNELSGIPGKVIVHADRTGRQLAYGSKRLNEPVDGYNINLTIDEVVQHFSEKAVDNALANIEAKGAWAIVMDVKTGGLLSMVSKPEYNPNTPRIPLAEGGANLLEGMTDQEKVAYWSRMWTNPNVTTLYEPGSTFKLITGAAGVEENVINRNTQFVCNGYKDFYGVKLKCWRHPRSHGAQTFAEGMQNSCNPVFMDVGEAVGKERFYSYFESFGFREKTGIKLPAETKTLSYDLDKLNVVEFATMTFGHGLSTTPLQMVTSLSAIGNDGKLMKPMIVEKLTDYEGNIIEEYKPTFVRQAISESAAKELRVIMETVITEGSGIRAHVPGYRIGGKTGTTEKLVNGQYSKDKVYSSFAAIAPIDDPRIAVLIVVDEPVGEHFGSRVAAPIAQEILRDSLRYLEIKPSETLTYNRVRVPNVEGLSLKEARKAIEGVNLHLNTVDPVVEGVNYQVVSQYPKAAGIATEHAMMILYLEEVTE